MTNVTHRRALSGAASALALVAACAAPPSPHDWSTYSGPGAAHFRREEYTLPQLSDPLERLNRRIFAFNEAALLDVVEPVAQLYRALVPGGVRRAFGRAFENLRYPGRAVNNLLQAELADAWQETKRFAVNSTVGVAGLFDPARRMGLAPRDEDFGTTLRAWGWTGSTYLMAPILGATSTRDALGDLLGLGIDPATYCSPASYVRGFNRLADDLPELAAALHVNGDPYELARLLHVLEREVATDPPAQLRSDDDGATETLSAIFLAAEDDGFRATGLELDVVHPTTGGRVPYTAWLQPSAAPVDYILPGLGGHRGSGSSVALAEAVHKSGKHAVTISSSMNHEFIRAASSVDLPGFLPVDAHDTHVLLDAIDRDLCARFPGRFTSRRLGGISFGGATTLFIAAEHGRGLIEFDVYLAVNAPLSLEYGARQLDAFYNTPMEVPEPQRDGWVGALFAKTLAFDDSSLAPATDRLEFTSLEARFLIGLVFRATLREVIAVTQLRRDQGVLHAKVKPERRAAAYREIDQFSLTEYVYAFLLPYYAARLEAVSADEAGAKALFRACDVRSIASALRDNPNVRFATTRNDFLLAPGDLEWITGLLGPGRVTVFERGGHLGNLHREDVQAALAAEVAEAADGDRGSGAPVTPAPSRPND